MTDVYETFCRYKAISGLYNSILKLRRQGRDTVTMER